MNIDEELLSIVRCKKGIYIINPFKDKKKRLLDIPNGETYVCNQNKIAVIFYFIKITTQKQLIIIDTSSLQEIKRLELEFINATAFSPNNKYLIIIQKKTIENNLKIICLNDYEIVLFFNL